jgi:DNA polymerase delta subunit 3
VSCSLVARCLGRVSSIIPKQHGAISATNQALSPPPLLAEASLDKGPKPEVQAFQSAPAVPPGLPKIAGGVTLKEEPTTVTGLTGKGPVDSIASGNVSAGKRKVGAAGGEGSLASLWGKAPNQSSKPSAPKSSGPVKPITTAGDADRGIRAMEASVSEASSDDDVSGFAQRRGGQLMRSAGRKRQIVLDEDEEMSAKEEENPDSIECEEVVSLASPPSKSSPSVVAEEKSKENTKAKVHLSGPLTAAIDKERKISWNEKHADGPEKVEGVLEPSCAQPVENQILHEGKAEPSSVVSDKAPSGPKRKKVLRTRIDNRGREGIDQTNIDSGLPLIKF